MLGIIGCAAGTGHLDVFIGRQGCRLIAREGCPVVRIMALFIFHLGHRAVRYRNRCADQIGRLREIALVHTIVELCALRRAHTADQAQHQAENRNRFDIDFHQQHLLKLMTIPV